MKANNRLSGLHEHISCRILSRIEDIISLKEEWDTLYNNIHNQSIFQSYHWIIPSWKHYGSGKSLFIIIAIEDDKLVGIAPLCIRYRFKIAEIEPIGHRYSYFSLVVENNREDVIQAIAEKIVDTFPKGIVHIPYYASGDSSIDVFLASLNANNWKESRWVRDISHYLFSDKGYNTYLSTKSRKARQNLKYESNRLNKTGKIEMKYFTGEYLNEDILNKCANIQRKSWLFRRGIELVDTPFYKEAIIALACNGQAEVYMLARDNIDIAYNLQLHNSKSNYLLQTGFEEELSNLSPGKALISMNLQHVLDRGDNIYDFLFGDAEYKRFWGNRTKRVFRVVCYKGMISWLLSIIPHRLHGTLVRFPVMRYMVAIYRSIKSRLKTKVKHRNNNALFLL